MGRGILATSEGMRHPKSLPLGAGRRKLHARRVRYPAKAWLRLARGLPSMPAPPGASMLPQSLRIFRCLVFACLAASCPIERADAHGTFHEQAEAIAEALRERPDDPSLLHRLAVVNLEHGHWDVALTHLARIDTVAPGKIVTDFLRGRALAAGGNFAEAKARLDAYIAVQPENPVAFITRARVASELGDAPQAAADAVAALAATPQPEPDLYFEVAGFLLSAGRGGDAIRTLEQGITKLGPIPALIDRAIELELALDRTADAIARSSARATTPVTRATHAALLARAGRSAEARAAWQALRTELTALPPLDRSSHAMLRLLEQANHALASQP